MMNEIARQIDAKTPGLQRIANNIAVAAKSQSAESIRRATDSFATVYPKAIEWSASLCDVSIQDAGSFDSPMNYLATAQSLKSEFTGTFEIHQLLGQLKRQEFHFQNSVKAFLKSGIQEALSGLKIVPKPKISNLSIPVALDDLLTQEKLKKPDHAQLQESVRLIDNMYSTLKNMQNDNFNLQINMIRFARV